MAVFRFWRVSSAPRQERLGDHVGPTTWCFDEAPVVGHHPCAVAMGVLDADAGKIRNGSQVLPVTTVDRVLWGRLQKPVPFRDMENVCMAQTDPGRWHAAWQRLQTTGLVVPWPAHAWVAAHWAASVVVRWTGPAVMPMTARYADLRTVAPRLAALDGQSVVTIMAALRKEDEPAAANWWNLPWPRELRAVRILGWLAWEETGSL